MPRLEDIERFKRDIRSLGNEAELLASWGEQPFDVPPPERKSGEDEAVDLEALGLEDAGLGADMDDALDSTLSGGNENFNGSPPSPEEADFASFLDGLSLEGDSDALASQAPEASAAPSAPEESLESFDLPDIMDATIEEPGEQAPAEEMPEEPFDESFNLPDVFAAPEGGERDAAPDLDAAATPEEDEGGIPESLLAGFDTELAQTDANEAFEQRADTDATFETMPSGGDLEDFSLPDFGDIDAAGEPAFATPEPLDEAAGEPPASTFEPPPQADEFAIPDLGPGAAADGESFEIGFEEPAAAPAAPQSGAGDDFDAFSARLGLGAEPEAAAEDLSGFSLDEAALGLESSGESGGDLTPTDTFNLESGWGSEFKIPGFEEPERTAPSQPAKGPRPGTAPSAEAERVREVSLSEKQVDALQDTLQAYPLNLRLAIEDAIANEKGSEIQRSKLVWALVEGASASKAAELVGLMLKRRIEVPKGFEKRSGAAFEAEKGSVSWILLHRVLPAASAVLVALIAAAALAWMGWRYVYTPIAAASTYRSGYESLRVDRYTEAEQSFARADELWRMKRWYYRYAEAYVERRQYARAEEKYERLLAIWPTERRAALDYAELERSTLLDYEKAVSILKTHILDRVYFDKDALAMLGDVYLEWGDEARGDWTVRADPPLPPGPQAPRLSASWLYEEARLAYASLIEQYGWKDPYLERMLRYFLRMEHAEGRDAMVEVRRLAPDFLDGRKKISALALAELGGYFLDRDDVESARRALFQADALDPTLPDTHYHLARYFRRAADPREELLALRKAVASLDALPLLPTYRLGMYVDVLAWTGANYLAAGEHVTAREFYERAVGAYDEALAARRLRPSARFGAYLAELAGIHYGIAGDDERALALYERAEITGFVTNHTRYHRAVILYRAGRLEEALLQAHRASLDVDETPALLLLSGNALAAREDWFAAQAAYSRLVSRLSFELDRLPLLLPQERPAQGELVELIMRASNNLGVAWWRLAGRTGDASLRSKAMASFAESMRYFDSLERDQATMIKPAAKNLAFLNLDFVLRPQRGIDLAIYPDVPKDLGR